MNQQVLTAKKAAVEEISATLKESNCAVIVAYQGLTVKDLTELRKGLKEVGATLEVHKNTLMRRAVATETFSSLDTVLTGQNALVTSKDSVSALPVLFKFARGHKAFEIKAGVIENTFCDQARLEGLSKVGSKEGAISLLLSVLTAPVRNLAVGLNAVAEARN